MGVPEKTGIDNEPSVSYSTAGNPPPYSSGPPPGFDDPPPGPSHVVMVQPTMTTIGPTVINRPMEQTPMRVTCKSCNNEILTKIEAKNAMKTHLCAAVLCLFGCWCCVCIPYCSNNCKNIDHYCPNCDAYIGGYIS